MSTGTFKIITRNFKRPHWFAGFVDGHPVSAMMSVILTNNTFNAWHFDDRAEAEALIRDHLGEDDFAISEVLDAGVSDNLSNTEPRP